MEKVGRVQEPGEAGDEGTGGLAYVFPSQASRTEGWLVEALWDSLQLLAAAFAYNCATY